MSLNFPEKIFILIPWFHPAYKAGGPVRSVANMVRQLDNSQLSMVNSQWSEGNETQKVNETDKVLFAFKIFTSNKDLDGTVLQNVEFDKWVHYSENTEVWYSSDNKLLPVLKGEISNESPAYLFIVGIYSWPFNFKPLLFCKGVKKIISVRGMLHPGALSQKSFKKKIYLSVWKLLGLQRKNIFHATDEQEKEYIQQVFGSGVNIKVAANFPGVLSQQPVVEKTTGCLKLVSVGLISPMKNILLILEAIYSILLRGDTLRQAPAAAGRQGDISLQSNSSSIEFNIYGPVKDKSYWEECEALIKKMPNNITVKYNSDVQPKMIENTLAQHHVFILPSKSENFGHAIYEALTAGRPVITSNHTPWNNLQDSKAGINVSTDNTNELQEAIEFFAAMNQEQLQEWSDGAREYALKAVDMERTRKEYVEMWKCENVEMWK